MDKSKVVTVINKTLDHIAPVQLWIGPEDTLVRVAQDWFRKLYCGKSDCSSCKTCRRIILQQHHAIQWISPKKYYTTEQIDTILQTISFRLDEGEKCFFVIRQADALQTICANRLLKSLEDPPQGYHFLLFAENKRLLLPTVVSRSVVYSFDGQEDAKENRFLSAFTTELHVTEPAEFLKLIDHVLPSERETREVVAAILAYWSRKCITVTQTKGAAHAGAIHTLLQRVMQMSEKLPMPGSSKIFWKNLYLSMRVGGGLSLSPFRSS